MGFARNPVRDAGVACVVAVAGALAACSHVPKEAVQLSYQIGQDLPRLHASYDLLIHDRFEDFRARRLAYVDEVWAPRFVARWVDEGKLLEVARGSVVWSFETAEFVAPAPGREKGQLLSTVAEWSRAGLEQIEKKRAQLVAPLDADEKELRKQVRDAFSRVIQANAFVTAHLASLRKVEEAQDEALRALRLGDLRDRIDAALAKASAAAAAGLREVREKDQLADEVGQQTKRMRF